MYIGRVIIMCNNNVIDLYIVPLSQRLTQRRRHNYGIGFNPNVMNVDSLRCHSNTATAVLLPMRQTGNQPNGICASWGSNQVQCIHLDHKSRTLPTAPNRLSAYACVYMFLILNMTSTHFYHHWRLRLQCLNFPSHRKTRIFKIYQVDQKLLGV